MELELNNVHLASQQCRQSDIYILQQTVGRFTEQLRLIIISQMNMLNWLLVWSPLVWCQAGPDAE